MTHEGETGFNIFTDNYLYKWIITEVNIFAEHFLECYVLFKGE